MLGKKESPGGYSDTMYRSRVQPDFSSKTRCCCFYLGKSVVVIFLVAVIVAAGAGSALADIFGYSQRWTYCTNRAVQPPYNIRTGWLYFSDNRGQNQTKLEVLNKATYILGLVGFAMNALSVIFAIYFGLMALCGKVGRGYICFSVLWSILLIATMIAYYVVAAFKVRDFSDRLTGTGKFAWPDWGWCCAAGSALAWLISAWLASVLPTKEKMWDAEEQFERQHYGNPNRPYAQAPVRGTPVSSGAPPADYVPSADPAPLANNATPPMASQENLEPTESPKKKSFVPSWSRKASRSSSNMPSPTPVTGGSYKDRANTIADRYKNRNASTVEMGATAPAYPKSAW